MRAAAYVNVLQAGATITAVLTRRPSPAGDDVAALENAVVAARLYAPEPLEQALLDLVTAARRWGQVAAANDPRSTAVNEAQAAVEQHLSQARVLMRDDVRPVPAVRYADDSTVLARMRIAYARERPRGQQAKALTAGWPQILRTATVEFVLVVMWLTIWFKAAVWLIGAYWWHGLPEIGWLPAAGLACAVRLMLVRTGRVPIPFPLPDMSAPTHDNPEAATTAPGRPREGDRV